jgi:hypothetical protein
LKIEEMLAEAARARENDRKKKQPTREVTVAKLPPSSPKPRKSRDTAGKQMNAGQRAFLALKIEEMLAEGPRSGRANGMI